MGESFAVADRNSTDSTTLRALRALVVPLPCWRRRKVGRRVFTQKALSSDSPCVIPVRSYDQRRSVGGKGGVMSDAVDPHLTGPYGPRTSSCATELVCRDCGYRTPLLDTAFKCPACGEGLDVDYDYERARQAIAERGLD